VIARFEQMTGEPMALVECLCVTAIQAVHTRCDVGAWSRHEQVKVRRHHANRVALPPARAGDEAEDRDEPSWIDVVENDCGASIAVRSDVVHGSGELGARGASHVLDRIRWRPNTLENFRFRDAGTCLGAWHRTRLEGPGAFRLSAR
jgi:hypothetical protein